MKKIQGFGILLLGWMLCSTLLGQTYEQQKQKVVQFYQKQQLNEAKEASFQLVTIAKKEKGSDSQEYYQTLYLASNLSSQCRDHLNAYKYAQKAFEWVMNQNEKGVFYKEEFIRQARSTGMYASHLEKFADAEYYFNILFSYLLQEHGQKSKHNLEVIGYLIEIYVHTGRLNFAKELAGMGKPIAQLFPQNKQSDTLAVFYNACGLMYVSLHKIDSAEYFFNKAMQAASPTQQITLQMNQALVLENNKKYSEAIKRYLQLLEKTTDEFAYAHLCNRLGVAYVENRQYKESIPYFEKAFALYDKHKDHYETQFHSLYNWGFALFYMQDYAQAFEKMDKALAILRKIFIEEFVLMDEYERLNFLKSRADILHTYEYFCVEATNRIPAQATLYLQKLLNHKLTFRGIVLNSLVVLQKFIRSQSIPELQAEFKELKKNRAKLAYIYRNLHSFSSSDFSEALNAVKANLKLINFTIKARNLEASLLKQFQTLFAFNMDSIKKHLKPNELYVETVILSSLDESEKQYYFLMLDKAGKLLLFRHPIQGVKLEKEALPNYLQTTGRIEYGKPYQDLWAPLEEFITKNYGTPSLIYFIPDGLYNFVNLGSLYNAQKQSYLIDQYVISYLRDARGISSNGNYNGTNIIVFGRPSYDLNQEFKRNTQGSYIFSSPIQDLPGTEQEAKSIHEIGTKHAKKIQVFLKEAASEAKLKNLHASGIIHIATHGFYKGLEEEVANLSFKSLYGLLNSGLLFAGSEYVHHQGKLVEDEDGVLTGIEICDLDYEDVDLVVLSACETGLGELSNSEGVMGLQRAFFLAGASKIIASLWPVNDDITQEFMNYFYHELFSTHNVYHAFLKTQKYIKEKHPEPEYWAPFLLWTDH